VEPRGHVGAEVFARTLALAAAGLNTLSRSRVAFSRAALLRREEAAVTVSPSPRPRS